ncbi:hypothetical protein HNE_3166 [Hyphomonas neptunium ATCC 15444]|uniref:Uncharacterized protein n=1 Tax=Hyphomonas neptunium (strain ATCC 15444) TaxID=228405 RepID=Q0BXF2_HYPNA|nr:hypothetical protein HNE_3166 [Hyphomonas neptunium ATCC 15444]
MGPALEDFGARLTPPQSLLRHTLLNFIENR